MADQEGTTARAEKRARATRLIGEHPDASDRQIGLMAGVSHTTVAAIRKNNPTVDRRRLTAAIKAATDEEIANALFDLQRSSAVQWHLQRIRSQRNLSRGQEAVANGAWRYRYSAERREAIVDAAKEGLTLPEIRRLFPDMPPTTVKSTVQRAVRDGLLAAMPPKPEGYSAKGGWMPGYSGNPAGHPPGFGKKVSHKTSHTSGKKSDNQA